MYSHNMFPYKPAQIPFALKYNHKPQVHTLKNHP